MVSLLFVFGFYRTAPIVKCHENSLTYKEKRKFIYMQYMYVCKYIYKYASKNGY